MQPKQIMKLHRFLQKNESIFISFFSLSVRLIMTSFASPTNAALQPFDIPAG
jgi:hypothetical protein